MKALAALLALTLLASCGAPHLHRIERGRAALDGLPATEARACMGEPLAVEATATGERWRYASVAVDAPAALRRACVVDLHLRDGQVDRLVVDNRAGWGFGSIRACSALLAGCIDG